MKRIYSLLIYIVFIQTYSAIATTYTWTGNTSTAWNTTSNWSPSGTPTTGDFVHIYSATYNPQLTGNLTLNGIYIHSGTLNLNGDTLLLNSGTSTFSGGTVTNGLLQLRGTEMTFNSTTFNAPIDAVVDRINLNGCTFNNYCYFETVTNVPGTGSGGAVFNDSVYLYHNYTGSGIWVMNNNTGHRFNGKVTIHNKGTKEITFAGAGINVFNGDIVLINTGDGGIMLGNDTLTAGHTISIGSGGFSAGDFNATNFYQDGNTAISLTFTGSALPSITGATFGGNFSIISNVLLFKNCTFNGTAAFAATGSGSSSWYGGNIFYGNATFTNNASAGNLRLDADTANTYYADATFGGSRELRVCYGNDVSSFYGNITTASNTTFNAGTGILCLAGSGTQALSFHSNTLVKNLMLNKSGGSATLATALTVSGTVTFTKGTLTTTSSNLLTINNGGTVSGASDSSFIDGPVKKIGNAAFVFPVGKGNSYRAIEISAPSNTSDAFTGEYFNTGQTLGGNMDTTINTVSSCNYWNLSRNTGSSNVTAKFQFDSTACDWNSPDSAHIGYWNGTKWVDKGVGIVDSIYIKPATALTSYGNFLFAYNLNHPTIGGLLYYAVVSNDSLILNDTLKAFDLSAARNINNITKLIDSVNFTSNSSDVESLKLKIQSEKKLMNNLSATVLTAGQIVGQTLTAGVYKVNGSLTIDDIVILQGDTSSVFVFNISGNLNLINNCAINLDGAKGYNVFFNVDSGITISGTTFLNGLFFANGIITVNNGFLGQAALYSLNKIIINSVTDVYSSYRLRAPRLPFLTTFAACGLNYTQATINLHQRAGSSAPQGAAQPAALNLALANIMPVQAYLFFTLVSSVTPPNNITVTFNNVNYNATLRRALSGGTCWDADGYIFTASYLVNIPVNAVNLSGVNTIDQLPTAGGNPDMDTDGACLFLIYRDECASNNQRAFGYIAMDYGLTINSNGVAITEQLSFYTPSTTYGFIIFNRNAFVLVGDYEVPVSNGTLSVSRWFGSSNVPIGGNMFDFGAVNNYDILNPSGPNFNFSKNQDDCANLSLIGAYYSVRNTNLCADFTLSATTVNSCQNSASGFIDLTVTPAGTYTYEWSNSATTQDLSGIAAGTYTVTVTNPNGCFHQLTVTVNPNAQLTVNISSQNSPPFCANNYPVLSANVSSGTSPYTYQWYDAGNSPISGATQSTYQISSFGTYFVIVTDANGCTGTNSIITSEDVINDSINQTPITCHNQNNGSLTAMPAGGATTYQWSNSATTQTITNLNAGTYTVTVTQNGCTGSTSATLTNPPILTVSVSKTNVSCQGGNDGTATATPSGGVTPYTYQWSSGGAATSQTNTGLTTGTYTVTVTDANGCTVVGSITIPFNSALPPAPQITGNGVAACMTTNSYSVINILSGGTYSWTASSVATGPSSGNGSTASNIDWNDYTSGSITFTVTAPSGCQNSATFNIYPCCDNVNDNVINTSVTELITAVMGNPSAYDYFTYDAMTDLAEINTGGTFGSNTFVINGTFTVDHDLLISNSNITLGPDAEIIIEDGYSLYIDTDDPSYLHACGSYMWKQITINPGGYLYAINSYFEDAKTAVVSENNSAASKEGGYWLAGNTFNRNYVSLYVSPYNKSHKGYLNVNYFKCATTTTGTMQGTITIDPHIGQTSISGVDVDNVTGDITIGGWGFGSYSYLSSNIFDGLCYGMRGYNSNLYIGNNIFMNMRNYNGLNSAGAGAGVFLDGLGMTNGAKAFIGLYDPGMGWTNNLFKENLYGVLATGNSNLNFTYTDFESTNNYGTGIWYARATNATLNVTDDVFYSGLPNTFTGLKTGVIVINCRNSSINIKKNIFSNSSVSNTGYSAIRLRNVAIPFQNMPNVTTVSGNQIDLDHGTGIELTRYNNAQIGGTDPNIININSTPSGAASYGIRIANSAVNDVWGNHIEGPNTLPLASVDNLLFGVLVQTPSAAASGSSANIITDNNIIKTGTGIGFLTTNIPQTVKCNTLDQNWSGVRLVGSSIGDQMPSGRDQNNTWNQQAFPSPSFERAIVSNPIISPKPIWYYGNVAALTSVEMTPFACMDFQSAAVGYDCDPSVLRAQQQLLTDVAAQEGYYDSLDADMQYWAQRQVYELLLSDDSLMLQGTAADTLLALWKDSVATGNIGAFRTVADSAIANAAYAAELNYNITPLNHAEENEQAVYALYFALAGEQPDSAQYEALSAIAAENAISGGGGVYMARAMIDTNADDVTGIASLRMIAPKQTDIKHSGKLYPNPANTVVYYENVLGEDENGKIKLMDMLGKEIKEYKLTKGSNLISIPVSELSKGIYMVKVEITERNSEIIKLVVN